MTTRFTFLTALRLFTAAFLLFSVHPLSAMAEERQNNAESTPITELPAVTVYAQKIEQDIRKVPTSVVRYGEQEIADAGIVGMSDVFIRTPGLSQLKGSRHSAGTILSMRGIISGNSDYANPSIGVYMDGAPISGGYDSDLYDVESVEVLRGPQGTLFGGNSMAGAFLIRSKQPIFDWNGRMAAGYASHDTYTLEAAGGGPLSDRIAFRIAGLYRATDGYYKNEVTDTRGEGGEDFNLRGQVLFQIDDRWSANLNLNGHNYTGNYSNLATKKQADDHPYQTFAPGDGSTDQESFAQVLTVNYQGENLAFTSITNHRRFDSSEQVSMNFSGFYDEYDNSSIFRTDAWSQEFRFSSPDAEGRFTWVAGVFGSYEEQMTKSANDMGLTMESMGAPYSQVRTNKGKVDVDVWNAAVFGQATYGITDKLYASAGLRYDHVTKKMDSSFSQLDSATWDGMPMGSTLTESSYNDESKKSDVLLPKVALEYRFTPDLNTYVTVSRGYKPGGFQPFNPQQAGRAYDPEYSWNYEAGFKGRFFDNKLETNLAAFYIDTEDLQFNTMIENGTVGSLSNAGKSRSKGIEFEGKAVIAQGLEIFGSAAYVDAKIKEVGDNVVGTYAGARVPFVPEFKATVGAQYTFDFGLYLRAENIFTGDYYVDPANKIRQKDFSITNLKVGYEMDDFKVYAYANNIFGEEYYTYGHTDSMAGVDVVRLGAPRVIGMMVEYSF